ncbi:MAG: substrate-binding domain-containing protein [Planctomycetia bacterium]|nr:substrate-binding domain-containing protein [Planctomycetia bacterium]
MNISPVHLPQVSLYLPSSVENFRQTLLGISRYVQLNGPWLIRNIKSEYWNLELMKFSPRGDAGRILRIDERIPGWLLKNEVPTVVLNPTEESLENPRIAAMTRFCYDFYAVGRMAATFFLEKELEFFAYVGLRKETEWTRQQRSGYEDGLCEVGRDYLNYQTLDWERNTVRREMDRMGKWLVQAPKPLALFAANELIAPLVLQTCLWKGIAVPQEVSVLSMGGDEVTCELCQPTLSSISFLPKERGYQMAAVLDRLMRGEEEPGKRYTYVPKKVVERGSTQRMTISDTLVLQAKEFIQGNFTADIGIAEVVRYLGISRSTVERHFKRVTGNTIPEEILHCRMEKMTKFLILTNLPTAEIARRCGFRNGNYACRVFRTYYQMTMSEYRKRHSITYS